MCLIGWQCLSYMMPTMRQMQLRPWPSYKMQFFSLCGYFLQIVTLHHRCANIRKAESRSKVYFDSAEAHHYVREAQNIAKVESRGKIYFHYAETQAYVKHSKFSNYINDSTFLNGIYFGCVCPAESCRIAAQCIRCLIFLIIFAVLNTPCLSALFGTCWVASQNYWAGSKSGLLGYADGSNYKQSLKYHRNVE